MVRFGMRYPLAQVQSKSIEMKSSYLEGWSPNSALMIAGSLRSITMTESTKFESRSNWTFPLPYRTHSLPFQGEVKTPIVMHNKRIYAFISRLEKANSKRRVLVEGNSEGWSCIGWWISTKFFFRCLIQIYIKRKKNVTTSQVSRAWTSETIHLWWFDQIRVPWDLQLSWEKYLIARNMLVYLSTRPTAPQYSMGKEDRYKWAKVFQSKELAKTYLAGNSSPGPKY